MILSPQRETSGRQADFECLRKWSPRVASPSTDSHGGCNQQHGARHAILSDLFPDLGESTYENWDFTQADVLMALLNLRMLAAPDETPSMVWLHRAHVGPLPLIWDLLDHQPSAETLHLLSLAEFNGCSPDALVRNAFVVLRMVATDRYLHLKSQELHEALIKAHKTIGFEVEEKVQLREAAPAVASMSSKYQEALATAASNAERTRLTELGSRSDWLLGGLIGLAQQDHARVRDDLTAALVQAHAQVADLRDRLKASLAAERPFQPAGDADLSARLQHSRANDERISKSLRQRQWTEGQITTLLFPSSPSSSSAVPGSNASSSSTNRPALMSTGVGSTSPMYAAEAPTPQLQTEGHLLGNSLLPSLRGHCVGYGGQSLRRRAHCRRIYPP